MSHSETGYHALKRDEWKLGQYDNGDGYDLVPKTKVEKSSWRTKVVIGVLILSNISSTLVMLKQSAADSRSELGQLGMF